MNKKLVGVGAILGLVVIVGLGVYFSQVLKPKKIGDLDVKTQNTPTQQAPATVTSKACDVLTLDIAETIFKEKAVLAADNSSNSCTYTSSNNQTSLQIVTMLDSVSTDAGARQSFEQAKSLAYSNQTEAITGLAADGAYYATTLHQLSILKGNHWLIITAYSNVYPTDKEASVATAKLVLEKLK